MGTPGNGRLAMSMKPPLTDNLGRIHSNLRMSVTDRCNIRCFYCMPEENVEFKPRNEILSFEELIRFARITSAMGVNRIRLTGGEPLVRKDLAQLIGQLKLVKGIADIALTTNAVLLAEQAESLKEAGLDRINISLDTLNDDTFFRLSRRRGIEKVLDGISAAQDVGIQTIKLNAIAIRGLTETEIIPLAEFASQRSLELRFIEFMPLDADDNWGSQAVLTGQEIRQILEDEFGELIATDRPDSSQPAVDFRFASGKGRIGFINPVSQPFCGSCNRLRITAEGKVRNCLFSIDEWDARALLRNGSSDEQIEQLVRDCVAHKKPAHGIDTPDFEKPSRAMYQIGG